MKTIVILTDSAGGGVNVQFMPQMTTAEIESGMRPEQSPAYQCAMTFNAVVTNAKLLAVEMRAMHADMAEKSLATEQAKCLH